MKKRILGFVVLGLSVLLMVGVKTFFAPCGVHDDGMYSTCHWAGQAVFALGIVLSVQALLALCLPDARIRAGISLSMVPGAIAAALLPGHGIALCMMETMRCHTIMKPAAMVIGIAIAVLALLNAFLLAGTKR